MTTPGETVTLCAVAGEVDHYTVDELRTSLIGALNNAAQIVTVDLSRVSFFGIAGLRVLVEARVTAGRTGRRLRLVVGASCVDRLLVAAGEADAFDLMPDLACAVLDPA
ncbi:STAS domain-containing protein [Nocardia sp. NBC_01377]|uniref:STAS domain-containing protein n=1 Tax=Nocardia sp. NBC_01377 TaxID=2903595 RepID=UPI00324FD684